MVTENNIILTEKDCVDLILDGLSVDSVYLDEAHIVNGYNKSNNEYFGYDSMLRLAGDTHDNVNTWLIPDKYKSINVKEYVLNKTSKPEEIDRVEMEYKLYEERHLIDILRCMIFLIDFFKENDIVWGVGRGSSVSSYILYLIGVHKIDSLRYQLDISEFLK